MRTFTGRPPLPSRGRQTSGRRRSEMLSSAQTRVIVTRYRAAAAGDTASSAHPGESSEGSEGMGGRNRREASFRAATLTWATSLSSEAAVQMNNSSVTNKPMFQRSAPDTNTIASPLRLIRPASPAAMFDSRGFEGRIYRRGHAGGQRDPIQSRSG